MAIDIPADTPLTTLGGETAPIESWTTTFHLALMVLDPFELESSWIVNTAVRVLRNFAEADCRAAFLVTCSEPEARQFLGPLVDELLVFVDADRLAVKGLELDRLPAFVHVNINHAIDAKAEGWQPDEWRAVAEELATTMSWRRPEIPLPDDPVPFTGTPALG
ncbi:MAG: hypothetical protein HYX32_05105 [Actinobacteria bacterium]|nr:hypothetical protein [Actinomycetota bacterium]